MAKSMLNLEKIEELGGAGGVVNHVRDIAEFCAAQGRYRPCTCGENIVDPMEPSPGT